MALTTNYSFQFNGLTFGSGTPFQVYDVDGLEGLPDLRTQDDNRGFNDGEFSGRDFYSGRHLTFTILVLAGNGNTAQQNLNLLQAALIPQQSGTTTLYYLLDVNATTQRLEARVRSRKVLIDPEYTFGYIRAQYTFFAPDPRYYDDTLKTITFSPTPTANGRTYSRTFNYTYGGVSNINQGTVVNAGTVATDGTITIAGPATLPVISVSNSAGTFALTVNYALQTGDVLTIDTSLKTLTLNGSTARNLLLNSSSWFNFPPGSSTLSFSASNVTTGTTSVSVTYRNAYV